ncbi:MAG: hypothetical protein JST00_31980 [Deltaproteobacteria bacterium]|nr:hypothetical protein [Deltaproteobacteria bacterium]
MSRRPLILALSCLVGGLALGAVGARVAFRPSASTELAPKKPVTRREKSLVLHDAVVRDAARVDVYLPATDDLPTPWVLLVHERGWPPPDDRERTSAAIADALQRRGIAVAVVSFTVKEGVGIEKTTELVAEIAKEAAKATKDWAVVPEPVLMGDELGASVVASLALDPKLGVDALHLRGVVCTNGIFEGGQAKLARADAPPFLLLSAHDDSRRSPIGTRAFARALERAGAKRVHAHHVGTRDTHTLTNLSGERNDIGDLVASFVRGEPTPGGPEGAWLVDDTWSAKAPLSSEGFHADAKLVQRAPTTAALKAQLVRIYGDTMRDLEPWPGETFDFVDLDAWLTAHPELGSGSFVIVRNVRGEELVLRRDEIARKKPVVVVGIDDEKNLFRMFVTYSVLRSYSWKPETAPRPLLARPVGAFLHWPGDGPTAPMRVATLADFALQPSSFKVVATDPLAPVRGIANPLGATLVNEQGCLQCHAFKGVGPRAHHLRAADGKPSGGDALPLEEYPSDVIRRFLFEQDDVAKSFGVNPLHVDPAAAKTLFAMLSKKD